MNKNDPILNCPILGGVVRSMVLTAEFAAELKRDEAIEARAEQRREMKECRTWDDVAEQERDSGAAP